MTARKKTKPVEARTTLLLPFRGKAPLLQGFGDNPRTYERFGQKGHNGLDFGLYEFTPVLAMASGTIRSAGEGVQEVLMGASAGICILIQHEGVEGRFLTGYAHLNIAYVKAGDQVEAGDIIGLSGKTGAVTGQHLHVELLPQPLALGNGYMGRADLGAYLIG